MPNPKWRQRDVSLCPTKRQGVIDWLNELLVYTAELEDVLRDAVRVVAEPLGKFKTREELYQHLRDYAFKMDDFRVTSLVAAWILMDQTMEGIKCKT